MPPLRSAVVSVPVVGGRKEALSPGLRRARVVPISQLSLNSRTWVFLKRSSIVPGIFQKASKTSLFY